MATTAGRPTSETSSNGSSLHVKAPVLMLLLCFFQRISTGAAFSLLFQYDQCSRNKIRVATSAANGGGGGFCLSSPIATKSATTIMTPPLRQCRRTTKRSLRRNDEEDDDDYYDDISRQRRRKRSAAAAKRSAERINEEIDFKKKPLNDDFDDSYDDYYYDDDVAGDYDDGEFYDDDDNDYDNDGQYIGKASSSSPSSLSQVSQSSNSKENESSSTGNFWSNPARSFDDTINRPRSSRRQLPAKEQRGDRSSRSIKNNNERLSTAKRFEREERQQEQPSLFFGKPNSRRPRPKTTFRSGTPAPPAQVTDLYNRLFWYGFDPDDDAPSPADKTVFGGTKGKFNGLAYLDDGNNGGSAYSLNGSRRRPRSKRNQLPPSRRDFDDEDYEEDDYYYSEKDDARFDEEINETNYKNNRKKAPRPDTATKANNNDNDDNDISSQQRPQTNVTPPYDPPRPERRSSPTKVSVPSNQQEQRQQKQPEQPSQRQKNRRRQRTQRRRVQQYDDMEDKYWNEDDDDMEDSWFGSKTSSWFEDDEDEDEEEYFNRKSSRRGRRKRDLQSLLGDESLFDKVNSFFGLTREDLDDRAAEYNRQMGLKNSNSGSSSDSISESWDQRRRATPPNRRRKGYGFPFDGDEEDEPPAVTNYEIADEDAVDVQEDGRSSASAAAGSSRRGTADSEEETMLGEETDEPAKQRRELSWEKRSLAVQRVPPAGISAWGPSGALGMDARTKAISDALEDILSARQWVVEKEKSVVQARDDVSVLRVNAELERKRSQKNRGRLDEFEEEIIQDRLRSSERKVDAAGRAMRKAQNRLKVAKEELSELEVRHWAVLNFFSPDLAEEGVAEALRELEKNEPAARRFRDKAAAMAIEDSDASPGATRDVGLLDNTSVQDQPE